MAYLALKLCPGKITIKSQLPRFNRSTALIEANGRNASRILPRRCLLYRTLLLICQSLLSLNPSQPRTSHMRIGPAMGLDQGPPLLLPIQRMISGYGHLQDLRTSHLTPVQPLRRTHLSGRHQRIHPNPHLGTTTLEDQDTLPFRLHDLAPVITTWVLVVEEVLRCMGMRIRQLAEGELLRCMGNLTLPALKATGSLHRDI